MDILNAKQAFEALQNQQTILCRAIGAVDFEELSNVPATVFIGTDYEFCIAPRFICVGGASIEVPEPMLSFDDLVKGVEYYYPNFVDIQNPAAVLHEIHHESLIRNLMNAKMLHKNPANAILHAKALIELSGGSSDQITLAPVALQETASEPKPVPSSAQAQKKLSADLKKKFATALNNAKSDREVSAIETQIIANDDLNKTDRKYLEENLKQAYEQFKPCIDHLKEYLDQISTMTNITDLESIEALINSLSDITTDEDRQQLHQAVADKKNQLQPAKTNDIKSASEYKNLVEMINTTNDIQTLESIAKKINAAALNQDHELKVLAVYGQRKTYLEQQLNLITDDYVSKVIAKAQAALSIDSLHALYADPAFEELSDQEKSEIDQAVQQREQQLS